MNRKSAEIRTKEFDKKACIIKLFGKITLSNSENLKLFDFWDNWLKNHKNEPTDSLYITLYKLLKHNPTETSLYSRYIELKKTKTNSREHFILLYGTEAGEKLYLTRNSQILKKRKIKESEYIKSFFNRKPIFGLIDYENLDDNIINEINLLFKSANYNSFKDNELIIVDLINYFKPDFIGRYQTIKKSKKMTWEYFIARYSDSAQEKFDQYKRLKQNQAKNNFANLPDYWILRGQDYDTANELAHNTQKIRAGKAKLKLTGRIGPRSIHYWIAKNYSIEEAKDRVYQIQARDLNFFINKYGNEKGLIKFNQILQQKITTWFNRPLIERYFINQSKGRTYKDLIEDKGIEIANSIMSRRLNYLNATSIEANNFFRKLNNVLSPELANKSITGYKGPERWINHQKHFYFLDYVIENCVIEYNGSYWHADLRDFNSNDWHSASGKTVSAIWSYDAERNNILKSLGYNILTVWSNDCRVNYENEIQKCVDFLNENCQ